MICIYGSTEYFSSSHSELEAMELETSYSYNVLKPNTKHKQTC